MAPCPRPPGWLITALALCGACGAARPLAEDDLHCGDRPRSAIHDCGILDPTDKEQFHGAVLRQIGWNFNTCASCHGDDFAGGRVGKSCLGCHPAGPTACETCHGRRFTGAHKIHVQGGNIGKPLDCSECHRKPASYRDPGHLYDEKGAPIQGGAAVIFGPLASGTLAGAGRRGAARWDPEARTCSDIYCHGAVFADSKTDSAPKPWIENAGPAACSACHGLPPSSHSLDRCVLCHGKTVDLLGRLRGGALHLNGRVDIGDGSGTCSACHGGPSNPAPPTDLRGNTDIWVTGVGVHQSHVGALHRLRGPIPCSDCHRVPAQVDSPGHIDGDLQAEVFPDGLTSLARADGAVPVWDHDTTRCSEVYCHGGGAKLGRDKSPSLTRAPLWTKTGQGGCGAACHGVPPLDDDHGTAMRLTDCARCHPKTMDTTGAVIVTGPPGAESSTHINGVVDGP